MGQSILITGGAGYIGSHTAYLLFQKGYNVIVLDSLEHKQKYSCNWTHFIKGDFSDKKLLKKIFENYNIQAIMHFAAFIEVGESVKNPLKFYENNVIKTITLLQVILEYNIKNFIFSSSCAVYGNPQYLPLTEDHPKNPINPYGKNKLIIEMALEDFEQAYNLNYVNLRYFNAAGAMPEYGLGEQHDPETHIIPIILRAAMNNETFYLFGNNYKTKDGSCIRDYIHVWDLAQAHWLALEYLNNQNPSDSFNLGTGNGFSIRQLINTVEHICGLKINILHKNRRKGDPPILIADAQKAKNVLGWKPQYSDLEFIIKTAYEFESLRNFTKHREKQTQKE